MEEHTVVALEGLDGLGEALEIVVLGILAGALGAVHPDLDELALVAVFFVVAKDFFQLAVIEIVVVIWVAV